MTVIAGAHPAAAAWGTQNDKRSKRSVVTFAVLRFILPELDHSAQPCEEIPALNANFKDASYALSSGTTKSLYHATTALSAPSELHAIRTRRPAIANVVKTINSPQV
jgi:hypothetical protein